jgi:hypothetical protein
LITERDASYDQSADIVHAILARPVTSPAHLVDMAIVARCFEWENSDNESHEAMTLALLKLGGIPESMCNQDAYQV